MMQEIFGSGKGKLHLSNREIQRMKKNMKKVPLIQEKSEEYHKLEESSADEILQNVHTIPTQTHHIITSVYKKIGWKEKILHILKNIYSFFIPTHTTND